MKLHVIRSVFQRDFVSYFSNPTGYVFICAYVVLCSLAAFWSTEFFSSNLANLDQLNRYYPLILLVFVPAITMSIWADEKRQGTDELLLTIPATDFEVVTGKYLAAAAIFGVALLYSFLTNISFLSLLGQPDLGLMLGTHVGYLMMGLAMISVGMAASFLTPNLTVSYILGALLNAPLVALMWAESWVPNPALANTLKEWSVTANFRDFARGVISFSGIFYFVAIVVLMLFVAIILIGRRHWMGGRNGGNMFWQHLIRTISLAICGIAATAVVWQFDLFRWDATQEKIGSLSPNTVELMRQLRSDDKKPPVAIDAYISSSVPESYAQTRLNLLSSLREFDALGGNKVQVRIYNVEPFSKDADRAEDLYGIRAQPVQTRSRGAFTEEEIFLGVAVTAGTEPVVIPFFDKGIPVEYELVRSISTVSDNTRKKLGVVTTDVDMFGGFDFQRGSSTREQMVITELKKQYNVVRVDPNQPITEKFDALLAVQPSTLSQSALDNFTAVVLSGVPTAIFEDPVPFPGLFPGVPGTDEPKTPQGGFMGMNQPPQPKGNIAQFWRKLGIEFTGDQVIWQRYNPYPAFAQMMTDDWVFVKSDGFADALSKSSPVTKDLREVLFIYPGAIRKLDSCTLDVQPLCQTGGKTGTLAVQYTFNKSPFGISRSSEAERRRQDGKGLNFTLAAHIKGSLTPPAKKEGDKAGNEKPALTKTAFQVPADGQSTSEAAAPDPFVEEAAKTPGADAAAGATTAQAATGSAGEKVNIVLVGDIDLLSSALFDLRARGADEEGDVNFQLENVPFVLNVMDDLTGDNRFVEIRSRLPRHRTLTRFEEATSAVREQAELTRAETQKKFDEELTEAQNKLTTEVEKLEKRDGGISRVDLAVVTERLRQEVDVTKQRLELERNTELRELERDLTREIRTAQDRYKSVVLAAPPILPTLCGLAVFFRRRAREKEGVSKARLR